MSMTNTTKMANRYGLNLTLTNIADEEDTAVIDFANEVSLEVTGEITWATGGQGHVNMIGFRDPKEGTLTISTQVTNMQVMQLLAGGKLSEAGGKASFKDDAKIALKYYKIEGETVWRMRTARFIMRKSLRTSACQSRITAQPITVPAILSAWISNLTFVSIRMAISLISSAATLLPSRVLAVKYK